jgi:hypothetical protein
LDTYHIIKLSPVFVYLDYLYLKSNRINPDTYDKSENKKFIEENISNIEKNTTNLKYLSLEQNKINSFFFGYKIFKSPKLKYINLNQNIISDLIPTENIEENQKLLEEFNIKNRFLFFYDREQISKRFDKRVKRHLSRLHCIEE